MSNALCNKLEACKERPFKVDLGHTGVSEHVRSGSMSKYAMLATLSARCLVLQHIAKCQSWWGREWWSYHRYCDWSLHPLARLPFSVTPHSL